MIEFSVRIQILISSLGRNGFALILLLLLLLLLSYNRYVIVGEMFPTTCNRRTYITKNQVQVAQLCLEQLDYDDEYHII